jgi:uncharacterized membrane protein required for colicin V production
MNAFDWILVAIWVVLLLWGIKTGFVKALFVAVAIFVAFIITGRIAPEISAILTTSEFSEAIGDSVIYWVTFAVALFAANFVLSKIQGIINTVMTRMMLGPVDKLAGMAMGGVLGLLFTIAFVMTSASYAIGAVALPDDRFAGQEKVAEQLANSTIVPFYVSVWDILPADSFGLIPAEYSDAMDQLDGVIEFSDITDALTGDQVLDFVKDRVAEQVAEELKKELDAATE